MPARNTRNTRSAAPAASHSKATALLVGLTHVDPDAYGGWDGRPGCWGCDEDVAAMRLILEREGYTVHVLADENATIAAVNKALHEAAKASRKGDTFFFYYSGHGGRMEDQGEGNDGHDESDGWDETLCLFDGHFRDDNINEAWVRFPAGSAIFMLSDCCHSGTNFRALGRPRVEAVDFIRDLNGDERMKASLLHISGCKDEQTSGGLRNGGLFTLAVAHIWNKGCFKGTWDQFHDLISAELPEGQRPQGNLYGKDLRLETRRPFAPLGAATDVGTRSAPPADDAFPTLELLVSSRNLATRDAASGPDIFARTSTLDSLGQPGSREFIKSVQENLARFGLYDPGAIDGSPGPFTDWALGEFKIAARTHDEAGVGPRTAEALLSQDVDALFPLDPSGSGFASRIIRLMQEKNHWICRHPDCVNIVYVEGVNPDGRTNDDRPNVFNDLRTLIRIDAGAPVFAGKWEGATEPGRHFTERPMDARGAARIAFGQFYAWQVGPHGTDGHEALRQVRPVTVHRDLNRDYVRTGDLTYTGLFYINQHWGYDLPVSNLGRSSAGCLVGRTRNGHREFMRLVKQDARAEASGGYKFTTTVLDATQLP